MITMTKDVFDAGNSTNNDHDKDVFKDDVKEDNDEKVVRHENHAGADDEDGCTDLIVYKFNRKNDIYNTFVI